MLRDIFTSLFQNGSMTPRSYLEGRLLESCRSLLSVVLLAPDEAGSPGALLERCACALRACLAQEGERWLTLRVDVLAAVIKALSGRQKFRIGKEVSCQIC